MKIIGLSGGSGAGKGLVSSVFAGKGIPVLYCDKVSREVTFPGSSCLEQLTVAFGMDIMNVDGSLNRTILAQKAFSDKEKLKLLNSITHRHILEWCEEWLAQRVKEGHGIVVIDAPQLFESGFDKRCDIIISVIADRNARLERIMSRDNINEKQACKRLLNQYPDNFFIKKSHYVLENNDAPEVLEKKASELAEKLLTEREQPD